MPDSGESAEDIRTGAAPAAPDGAGAPEAAAEAGDAAPEAASPEAASPEAASPDVASPDVAEESAPTAAVSERLLDARDLALAALHEITPASTVGPAAGYLPESDGVLSLRFENRLPGYPGWYWTVTVAQVDDEEPTVLEAELLPGSGALLAPEWVPWAERLADYRAHQAELAAEAEQESAGKDGADGDDLAEDDLSDDEILDDDDTEDDELDEDDDPAPRLHAGDVDGVDIDELDDSVSEDELDDDTEDDETEDDETEDDGSEEE